VKTYRLSAVMAGALYILGTVAGVLSVVVVGGFPDEDFALQLAADPTGHMLGAFLIFVMGVSLASMPLFLYPLFRKNSEPLALGMLIFRGPLEGTFYLITALCWVAMGAIGSHIAVGTGDAATLAAIGEVIQRSSDRLGDLGSILFLVGAACLYAVFFRTKLIPRWLSLWGLIAGVPYLVNSLLLFFDVPSTDLLYIPLAIQEIVMGGWLIIAGFNREAVMRLNESA
jgi:hypothetical protein